MFEHMNDLSKYENHLHETERRWFAVYTRFKSEKMAFRQLTRKGVKAYLPLQTFTRRYTRKVRKVELPLISCYVFVKITSQEYVTVLETEHVHDFVRFSRNLISIPDEEIDLMRRILGENLEVSAEPSQLQAGDRVEIIAGNLTGLQGRLVEQQDKKHMLVDLDRLGYTLRISVDRVLLQRAAGQMTVS
ncbi:MAG: UpxY family transcription antiterminator [Saprospiraceae bacterium]|nr:UpxY family transcription antiterminator [Saprospiraceae bacterium]MCB0625677.1 UpxY family transcription antiterminator [Saprospiraceae bacterium]MCB0677382.1 UpxY family transcription antiterminator [Saprospiraceae bacterium]MCB0681237.1 UpxY family transcription antiterminator [Saprospiraceae bacterium]